ncbi:MAG: ATP phosphoribosyltransferase regulatory subunit [Cyanobium sp.]
MALQPAAGAKDLHPLAVESNRRLAERLAGIYRLWGYEEVSPPTIERLDSLEAGGAIDQREILRLASDEPLGLRPELTAPIARAASTRMLSRPRPLRLWSCGTTFRTFTGDGGDQRISEQLQSGVELLGVADWKADHELMHLLLASTATLGLQPGHQPILLVGHHGLLNSLLATLPESIRPAVRESLTGFDPLALDQLDLGQADRRRLRSLLALRGGPERVLYELEQWLGPVPLLQGLSSLLGALAPAAAAQGIRLQFDPTFQPHFDLYDGLVFRLVCQGHDAPVAIASGGRYDALVGRFDRDPSRAAGTGFGFVIEAIRELLEPDPAAAALPGPWLVAAAAVCDTSTLLAALKALHGQGEAAELCLQPCSSREEAQAIAFSRGCRGLRWLGD